MKNVFTPNTIMFLYVACFIAMLTYGGFLVAGLIPPA